MCLSIHGRSPAAAVPMRFNMLGIHWSGSGTVEYRTRCAVWPLERLDRRGRRLRAGHRIGGEPDGGGRPRREPRLGRSRRRGSVPHVGHRRPHSGVLPLVARDDLSAADGARRGPAVDRAAVGLAGRREDHAVQAALRARVEARRRASHRRDELVLAIPGGCDRARDRGLPRASERLERHRLQLSRRPVRHGVRGSRRAASTRT